VQIILTPAAQATNLSPSKLPLSVHREGEENMRGGWRPLSLTHSPVSVSFCHLPLEGEGKVDSSLRWNDVVCEVLRGVKSI